MTVLVSRTIGRDTENTYIGKHLMQRLEFMRRSKYLTLDPDIVEVGLYEA